MLEGKNARQSYQTSLQIRRWLYFFPFFGKSWHILSWICLKFLRSEKLSTTKFWWLKDFVIISTVMSIFRNKNYNSQGGKSWQKDLKKQWESHCWQGRYDLSDLKLSHWMAQHFIRNCQSSMSPCLWVFRTSQIGFSLSRF